MPFGSGRLCPTTTTGSVDTETSSSSSSNEETSETSPDDTSETESQSDSSSESVRSGSMKGEVGVCFLFYTRTTRHIPSLALARHDPIGSIPQPQIVNCERAYRYMWPPTVGHGRPQIVRILYRVVIQNSSDSQVDVRVCVCVMDLVCKDYASSGLGAGSATGATADSTSSPPSSLRGVFPDSSVKINRSTSSGSPFSYARPQAVGSVGRAGRPSSMRLRITNAFVISAIV